MSNTKQATKSDNSNLALILGIISLIAWIIPIIGIPIAITGLVVGIKNSDNSKSLVAIAFCIASLIAGSINAYVGYNQANERNKIQNNTSTETTNSYSPPSNNYSQPSISGQNTLETYRNNFYNECLRTSQGNSNYCNCAVNVTTQSYNIDQLLYWEQNGYPDAVTYNISNNCV